MSSKLSCILAEQANAGQGWAERISGYFGSETQTLAEQNISLQKSNQTLTSQHKSDQQKLADTEQQLAMIKEHAYAASQQVCPELCSIMML